MLSSVLKSVSLHLPGRVRRSVVRQLFGWDVAQSASFGISWFDLHHLYAGEGASVGHGNIFRNVSEASLGAGSIIRNGNNFFGTANGAHLRLGENARVMSRHFFDLTDDIELQHHAEIAGRWSQLITHSQRVRVATNELVSRGISIGVRAVVGTGSIVICASLGEGSYLAAGGVLVRDAHETLTIYAGVPAVAKSTLPQPAKADDL